MSNQSIQELVFLCRLFGACIKRSQGAGGNISVKENNKLFIKASGVRLSSITEQSGFVVCDISGVFNCFVNGQEDLQTTLLSQTNQKPSMETFFHLLPRKYIVHIHPVFFCKYLCKKNAQDIFSKNLFPNSLFLSYVKPGYELANSILSVYNDEDIIFLENHGIILLGHSIEDIVNLYSNSVKLLESLGFRDTSSSIKIEVALQKETKQFVKPLYSVAYPLPSSFFALTPDHFLFLQDRPLVTTFENLQESFTEWKLEHSKHPSIIQIESLIYVLGNTLEECQNKEEYLLSYFEIYSPNSTALSQKDKQNLLECPKEQFRMQH